MVVRKKVVKRGCFIKTPAERPRLISGKYTVASKYKRNKYERGKGA